MSRRRATQQEDQQSGVDVPEWPSAPRWAPPPYPPPETVGFGARYLGLLILVLFVAVLGAGTFLLGDSQSDPLDDAEINRLILEKQEELASAPVSDPSTLSGQEGYTSALFVDSAPDGAVVLIDSDTLGITPLDGFPVMTGVYVLSIQKDGYAPHDTVIFVLEEAPAPQFFVALDPIFSAPRESPQIASATRTSTEPSASTVRPAADGARQTVSKPTPPPTEPQPTLGAREPGDLQAELRRLARNEARRARTENPHSTQSGLLTVLVRPWGSIYIDGDLQKRNADVQHTTSLPIGRHVIRAEHPALGARERVVEIRINQPQNVVFDLLESEDGDEDSESTSLDGGAKSTDGDESGNGAS